MLERRTNVQTHLFLGWSLHWVKANAEKYRPMSWKQYCDLANKLERRDGIVL